MNVLQWKALLLCAAAMNAGCSGSSGNGDGSSRPVLGAIHAVSDMAGITFLRVEEVWSDLEFGEATSFRSVDADRYDLNFDSRLPDDDGPCLGDFGGDDVNECTRLTSISLNALQNREYTVVLFGRFHDFEVLVYDKPFHEFDTDDDDDRDMEVQFFHLARLLGEVDVYLEPPGTNLSPTQVRNTMSPKGSFHALVNEGDYVLTLTAVADTGTILFTSDTFRLDRWTRVAFAIREGAGSDTSDIKVAQLRDRGATLADRNRTTELRVAHVTPRAGNVDVYARGDFSEPFVADLPFEETSAYGEINRNDLIRLDLDVFPAGNPGVFLARERIDLTQGERATFFLLGTPDSLDGLKSSDQFRRLATHARLRVVNGVRSTLDFYVVKRGSNIVTLSPTSSLSFRNSSGLRRFDPGDYDVLVTARGTETILFGPLPVELAAGGIYTIGATDTGESTSVGIVLLDDFRD